MVEGSLFGSAFARGVMRTSPAGMLPPFPGNANLPIGLLSDTKMARLPLRGETLWPPHQVVLIEPARMHVFPAGPAACPYKLLVSNRESRISKIRRPLMKVRIVIGLAALSALCVAPFGTAQAQKNKKGTN